MSITTHIDKTKDLTVFTVKSLLIFDEIILTIKAFYDGEPTKHVLWDLFEGTENLITLEQMGKIASFPPRFEVKRESGKTAIVTSDLFLRGLSNMIGMESNLLKAPYSVMIFSSKDTAYKWLDEP